MASKEKQEAVEEEQEEKSEATEETPVEEEPVEKKKKAESHRRTSRTIEGKRFGTCRTKRRLPQRKSRPGKFPQKIDQR